MKRTAAGRLWSAMALSGATRIVAGVLRPHARLLAIVVGVGAAFAAAPGSALATLWVSSSGTDTGYCSQANPCATISRAVSLAIPDDTIYIGPGLYTDHVTVPPSISGLTLQGSGMHSTSVSGGGFNSPGSVFAIQSGTTATINDLTISNGVAPNGGGVYNAGTLTLERTQIKDNVAAATSVGGSASGGGVYSPGYLTLLDSAVVANLATGDGGGVWMDQGSASRDLIDSNLISAPSALAGAGGGVFLYTGSSSTTTTVSESTIVNNKIVGSDGNPAGFGGGVTVRFANSLLRSDTIVGNTARLDGGVGNFPSLVDSILASNRPSNCSPAEGGGVHDVDVDGSCSAISTTDIVGVDPQLGPLSDNGGPTQTMAIPTSSPAYDAHTDNCTGTDQRGVSLLQRGATACDIGAYQVSAPTTYVANPSANSVTAYAGQASGDAAPVLTLAGSGTGLSQPTGVVTDVNGDVFVANAAGNSITEYAPEVTGNAAPIATIAGARTLLRQPQDLALDSSGRLYVTNHGNGVTEYAPGAHGNVAPVARIAGSKTRLSTPSGIVIDPDGHVRVTVSGRVLTFASTAAGNVAPLSQVASSALKSPRGLNFDPIGDLVVAAAGAHAVQTFAPNAAGSVQPISSLQASGLSAPTGLDFDVTGDVFVSDPAADSILEFPSATGSSTPFATIVGPDTGLAGPAFLSELPPPPAPRLRLSTNRRQSRKRILDNGVVLLVRASGAMAFRGQPVSISALARVGRSTIARAKPIPLRPGRLTLRLLTNRRAGSLLRRRHRGLITLTIIVRGDAGTQRRHLTITCTG